MGAEHFGSDMRNGRLLPVWRLAVCRQLVAPDFLLRCRESAGDASSGFHFSVGRVWLYINLMAKDTEATLQRGGFQIWNLEFVRARVSVS